MQPRVERTTALGDLAEARRLIATYEEWEKITERMGRDKQLKIYRTMLGLE